MIRACVTAAALWLICATSGGWNTPTRHFDGAGRETLRVALIGFVDGSLAGGQAGGARGPEGTLEAALKRDAGVALIEGAQIQPALSGIRYEGSNNMRRDEARRLGAAIGCDFFITGKKDVSTRSEAKGERHEEAILGVMIVDGRTWQLAAFDF